MVQLMLHSEDKKDFKRTVFKLLNFETNWSGCPKMSPPHIFQKHSLICFCLNIEILKNLKTEEQLNTSLSSCPSISNTICVTFTAIYVCTRVSLISLKVRLAAHKNGKH